MENRLNRNHFAALVGIAIAPWLIAASIEAATQEDDNTRIDIVGTGNAPQEAQLLTMRAGVTSFATSASRAVADNANAMAAIRRQLARHGIDAKDVRTGDLSLQPTSHDQHGESIKGFQVRHNLTIVFRDIAKTGAVMDTLVNAGANQISGPSFSREATPEALEPARLAAIRDADQRAQFYAKALGMKVKRVVTMRDGGGYASPEPMMARVAADEATQVSPGVDRVQVSVIAQYELTR